MTEMTFVKVERHPFGISQFSECVADVTGDDVLTVTCTQDGRIMQVFSAPTWRSAVVLDAHEQPVVAFLSKKYQADQLELVEQALASVKKQGNR